MKQALYRHLPAIPFEIIMLGGAIATSSQGNWKHFAASLFTFTVCLLPLLVEKWFRLVLPAAVHFVFAGFVFASFFSGEVLRLYAIIPYWDDLMHFASSFLIGTFIMMWLIVAKKRNKKFQIPAWFGAMFVFAGTLAIGLLWEVAEFTSDEVFGTFSQGASLFDTMMDLVYETISAAVASWIWALHSKGRKVVGVSLVLNSFTRRNT